MINVICYKTLISSLLCDAFIKHSTKECSYCCHMELQNRDPLSLIEFMHLTKIIWSQDDKNELLEHFVTLC